MRIRCITLYDVTKTGVSSRRKSLDNLQVDQKQLRQHCNFETLLQIIGLRCQPEDITNPTKIETLAATWGNLYAVSGKITAWQFEFTVGNDAIFTHHDDQLYHLRNDCVGVPMLLDLEEVLDLPNTIDISEQYKNIHFEVIT